jgi:hypothetical protein
MVIFTFYPLVIPWHLLPIGCMGGGMLLEIPPIFDPLDRRFTIDDTL